MRYVFQFPDIGEGIHEGKILEWYVKPGAEVKTGDSLLKMETDKVVTDLPSPRSGSIAARFGKVGEVVPVGSPLVEIDIPGLDGDAAQAAAREKPLKRTEASVDEKGFGVVGTLEVAGDAARLAPSDEGVSAAVSTAPSRRKSLATPVARAMARDLNIDIAAVTGTGPAGRVTKEDIRLHQSGFPKPDGPKEVIHPPETEILPLTQMRKAIARNMALSKQTAAHMTVFEEAEVGSLIAIRERFKAGYEKKGIKLTYLPFIIQATAKALQHHPLLNSQLDLEKGQALLKKSIHIGIAVDTEEGLVVPVIRDADRKSIPALAREIQEIKEKARLRKLALADLQSGTFTVTNYGSLGGTYGVPVINYPQTAILGIGRIMTIPVVLDGAIVVGHILPLSLSVDHRLIDGGAATRFIVDVIRYLKDPLAAWLDE